MTSVLGFLAAVALLVAAIAIDSDLAPFFNVQGLMIVVLGTFAVTAISFRFHEMIQLPTNVYRLLRHGQRDPADEAVRMLEIAVKARKQSDVKAIERMLPAFKDTPFLMQALHLVVDGAPVEEVEQLMRRESSSQASRHLRAVDFLRRAGDVAPAMGLIGTLIGLVKMLGTLDDPSGIGPAMAVALLTTFYGAVLAHLVFIPLAAKTEYCTSEEALVNNIYTLAATSIGRGENPRRLEMLLNTVLPPAKRIKFFK